MNKEALFLNDYRQDGRKGNEIRSSTRQMDIITHSSGSCLLTLGETKVIAWVKGPREAKSKAQDTKGSVKCYFSQAPYAGMIRKKDFKRDLKMREFSKILKEIFEQVISLELYVKSEIVINVLVIQNDGNYKSVSINAICLALINAGIYIKDTVIGMNIGCTDEGEMLYDLQLQEEKEYIPILNVAYLPHFNKFIYVELINAKTPYAKVEGLLKEAEKACSLLYNEEELFLKFQYYK